MSTRTYFNLPCMSVILTILVLVASVPSLANGYYQNPSNSYQKPPVETPRSAPGITCQSFGNICPGEGPYKCCDGLVCRPNTIGGASFCLPPLVPGREGEYPKCREITKLCIEYGDYDCCGDLSCVPGSSAHVVGVGVCLPMGGKKTPTNLDECQKKNQLCEPYGQYKCCSEFECVEPRTLDTHHLPPLPVDPKALPPGVGVCITPLTI